MSLANEGFISQPFSPFTAGLPQVKTVFIRVRL
jgi:hypothetical protein